MTTRRITYMRSMVLTAAAVVALGALGSRNPAMAGSSPASRSKSGAAC
jgi:hypothetical protein